MVLYVNITRVVVLCRVVLCVSLCCRCVVDIDPAMENNTIHASRSPHVINKRFLALHVIRLVLSSYPEADQGLLLT